MGEYSSAVFRHCRWLRVERGKKQPGTRHGVERERERERERLKEVSGEWATSLSYWLCRAGVSSVFGNLWFDDLREE